MKRFLSFLLCLVMLLSLLPTSVVYAIDGYATSTGGGIYVGGGGTPPPGGYQFADGLHTWKNWSYRGDTAVRLRAFPSKPGNGPCNLSPVQEYFTCSEEEGQLLINQLDNESLIRADHYNTVSGWTYFYNDIPRSGAYGGWSSYSLMQVFDLNVAEKAAMYKQKTDIANQFIKLCSTDSNYQSNLNKNLTQADDLSDLLTSEVFDDIDRRAALGEFLGLSADEARGNFYIVAEQLHYGHLCYMQDNRVYWGGNAYMSYGNVNFTFANDGEIAYALSRATYETKDPGFQNSGLCELLYTADREFLGTKIASGSTMSGKRYAQWIEEATWLQKKYEAPWKSMGFIMGEIKNGYSLYGFGDLSAGNPGANIAVEYQGDVNTSEPDKFVSTGSIMTHGDTQRFAYYDFINKKFVDSNDWEELLQFTGKIDTGEAYSICFTADAGYTIEGDNIPLETSLKSPTEDAPGKGYSSSSLQWGKFPASIGAVNVGFKYKVSTLDRYSSTASIENKFTSAFNGASTGGQLSSAVARHETSDRYQKEAVLEGCSLVSQDGMSNSSQECLTKQADGTYALVKDENFGVGYEFIIRGTPVTSRKITIKVDAENDSSGSLLSLSVDHGETWREDYTTATEVQCATDADVGYRFVTWFAVPWQEDDSIENAIVNSLNGLSEVNNGTVMNATYASVDSSLIQLKSNSPTTVGLGSTLDEPPVGYTVYEVMYKVDGVQRPTVGAVVLPAYMLNRYFNNIIQTSSMLNGQYTKFTLARDWTWKSWKNEEYCDETGAFLGWSSYEDDWVIEYYDSASTHEFGLDNTLIDRYYPEGTGNWSSSIRSKLTHAWQESMDTRYMPENTYVVDYAFNLVRGNNDFGDKRSVSGISYVNYMEPTGDGDNLLMIAAQFGVKPAVVKNASPARDSIAPLATYTEQFSIESRFQLTASKIGQHLKPLTHHHHKWYCGGCRGNSEDGYWCPGHTCCHYWRNEGHKFNVTCGGFYGLREGTVNTIEYQFKNTAFKYTTKNDLGVGKNDFLAGASSRPLTNGKRNSTSGSITDANFYRFATIRDTSTNLLHHPENFMVFKIGGTKFAQIDAQEYLKMYVMSEVKRTAASSGMYFFRLNANITSVPGTVYSDSMQGGTGMLGFNSTVSIPAGSDVTVAADPTGVAIDLYGYTLDLVAPDDNGKIGAIGANKAYNTVVRSSLDAYHTWGNSSSHADLLAHFNTWCDKVLDVKNFAADFQLFVNTTTAPKSENFSATIGRVERGSGGTVEEGIYQLVVEKGILQTTKGDYSALIQQIATDYGCDTGTATAMFRESAIYTAIINSMETCLNPKNNSKDVFYGLTYTPDIESDWTNDLGGNNNWYDETARTFVIRRFTNLGNKLCDVIATDKIDYQLAPTATNPYGENANSAVSYPATWKLNIFFDQDAASNMNNLLLGSSTYYTPQNGNGSFNPANNAFSVLFNEIPVANADFVIPASSTQDFYN